MSKRKSNPGYGKAFTFHGSFVSLILARRKEREIPGSFIHQHKGRYYVLKPKKIRNPIQDGTWVPRVKKQKLEVRLGASGKAYLFDSDTGKSVAGPLSLKEINQITGSIERQRRKRGYQNPCQPNPRKGTLIYGRVLKIFAQKTSGPFKGQRFVHAFKAGALMYGMPDGSLKIIHK